tara:strand:- start:362 stop:547 length:186 start_codon:yes stop_codon:yes gene_type:complete
MSKKKIIGWSLHVEWDNGKTENITDLEAFMPSNLIQDIDDSLTDLEEDPKKLSLTDLEESK